MNDYMSDAQLPAYISSNHHGLHHPPVPRHLQCQTEFPVEFVQG